MQAEILKYVVEKEGRKVFFSLQLIVLTDLCWVRKEVGM